MRSCLGGALVAVAMGLSALSMSRAAFACSLDGVPSLLANGHRVVINTQAPTTAAQLAAFTPFIAPHSYSVGQAITLTEDRREVAISLNAESMRRPWRWQLSDGSVAYGWTIKHSFKRAGHWQVIVEAYYPGDGHWYRFDLASLTVTGSAQH